MAVCEVCGNDYWLAFEVRTVSDDGVGITNLRDGSLGFGLVRTLVHQVGGNIEIGGELGVLVTITIPLAAEAA